MTALDNDYCSIMELRELLDNKDVSARELVDDTFRKIKESNPGLNSFVLMTEKLALSQAAKADERLATTGPVSVLDGIPLAVKDLYDTAGITTAGGTAAFKNRIPDEDSDVIDLLQRAGMIVVGKTNTHELAMGMTTNNPHYGPTRNPWDLTRVPGGSSGGSGAAVAAGQVAAALGTDTGGSVRNPAAFCGITGHKPTFGLVSTKGIIPLSKTLDHAGPMTRSVEECALMLEWMLEPSKRVSFVDQLEDSIAGLRLAIIPSLLESCQSGVLDSFEKSISIFRGLGVEITELEPMPDYINTRGKLSPIATAEGSTYIENILRDNKELIGERVRAQMLTGLDASLHDYVRALDYRREVEASFENALHTHQIHGYIIPTCPQVAEPITDDPENLEKKVRNTSVFNQTRQPSISVPNGFDSDDLPTGLMISTAQGTDSLTLQIAHNFQKVTDFHLQRPPAAKS
jgi:aspartyl-tRNA(Asn)/glutamyl-tRNA(Gln) amidotransferase subunit A